LVGAIAITRVEKAIQYLGDSNSTHASCTAGYGLALGSYKFFFGAMYLYSINCVFISTFFIVKYLKYPTTKQLDDKSQKQVRYIISVLIGVNTTQHLFCIHFNRRKKVPTPD
jgi:uncharacterized membrane protein